MRFGWFDAVRARNYHRDLYSIYKAWTENEMTIEALLKDILETNKEIASYLKHPPVVVHSAAPSSVSVEELTGLAFGADKGPEYDTTFFRWKGEQVSKLSFSQLLDALRYLGINPTPGVSVEVYRQAMCKAISEREDAEKARKAEYGSKPAITREQVERCILRAYDITFEAARRNEKVQQAVDNVMELVNGPAR